MLAQLDMAELGTSVAQNMDVLSADQVGGMLDSIADVDPGKASQLFDALGKAGSLGTMMAKAIQEGSAIVDKLRKIPLTALISAFKGGLEFLKQLKKVADSAGKLIHDIGDLQLPPEIDAIVKRGPK
jgi:hypothetical protein